MKLIEVNNVNKYFLKPTKIHVLKSIKFDVNRGELTSITGKSGSGKSTLLYLLSTMDTDFEGSIRINGDEIRGKKKKWLSNFRNNNIGFIFQFHYLLPEFSVLDNIIFPAMKQGLLTKSEIEYNAYELLRLLEIEDQAMKRTTHLSGGQQQRVAIARALINKPMLIIGDEPTGNLDSKNTEIVLNFFQKICHENGQTILTVTHDKDFASQSDNIINMKDGEIIQ